MALLSTARIMVAVNFILLLCDFELNNWYYDQNVTKTSLMQRTGHARNHPEKQSVTWITAGPSLTRTSLHCVGAHIVGACVGYLFAFD